IRRLVASNPTCCASFQTSRPLLQKTRGRDARSIPLTGSLARRRPTAKAFLRMPSHTCFHGNTASLSGDIPADTQVCDRSAACADAAAHDRSHGVGLIEPHLQDDPAIGSHPCGRGRHTPVECEAVGPTIERDCWIEAANLWLKVSDVARAYIGRV